jgi:hypothetical protein
MPRPIPDCPGPLAAWGDIPSGIRLHERVRVEDDGHLQSFTLVLEHQGERIVMVAHDAIGAKLFSVIQREDEFEIEALPAAVLRVPPLNVVRDLHRARFLPEATQGDPRISRDTAADGGSRVTVEHRDCAYTARFVSIGSAR